MESLRAEQSAGERRRGWRERIALLPVAAAFVVLLLIAAVPTGSRVLVFVAPGSDAAARAVEVVAAAGGRLVGSGPAGFLAIAESDDPHFTTRLWSKGAILVLNGAIAAACLTKD